MINFPLPVWLQNMPPGPRKDIALKRFYLRLAALYATEDGRIIRLAQMLDINRKTLLSQMSSHIGIRLNTYNGLRKILHPIQIPENLH
jgi:hypothetical protein